MLLRTAKPPKINEGPHTEQEVLHTRSGEVPPVRHDCIETVSPDVIKKGPPTRMFVEKLLRRSGR